MQGASRMFVHLSCPRRTNDATHRDTNTRVLPWQNIFSTNSVESCTTRCSDFGFTAAGMEFGTVSVYQTIFVSWLTSFTGVL